MKILTRYVIFSILKIAFVTILMFALILAAVELFSRMDSIMNGNIPIASIIYYILLSLPQYLLMVASISFLFAVTYFLSMLTANNEAIPILNAGVGPVRLRIPIFILSVLLTILGSVYQEKAVIAINAERSEVETELFGASSTRDARNIVLTDPDGYLIFTDRFSEADASIYSPVLVRNTASGIQMRVEAESASWSEEDGAWVFHNARVYEVGDDSTVVPSIQEEFSLSDFDIEPRLFRSQNTSIETMDSETAQEYLERLRTTDSITWQEKATDYYRRVFAPLAIFVLMFISASMSYRFKKNVLLFSVIQSLSIAVIYYVADMVFSIMGHQGAVSPYSAVIMPIVMTIILSLILSLLGRRI